MQAPGRHALGPPRRGRRRASCTVGDTVKLAVDDERREHIRAQPLGDAPAALGAAPRCSAITSRQKGSLVAPDRLRFDFSHFSPMTATRSARGRGHGQRARSARNTDSDTEVLPIDEAKQAGAVAMFGEKYGDKVRVVTMGESIEFCGGTHVRARRRHRVLQDHQETGIAQGVRRIEAVTGAGALDYLRKLEDELGADRRRRSSAAPFEVAARVDKLHAEQRDARREIEKLRAQARLAAAAATWSPRRATSSGVNVLAARVDVADAKALRDVGRPAARQARARASSCSRASRATRSRSSRW